MNENISIRYVPTNSESVKKTFDALMVWFSGDKDQVMTAMNSNAIAVANADSWQIALDKEVTIIKEWALGAVLNRGKQCQYQGIVYNIIQSHVVDNISFTPDITPALYRKAPVILPDQKYPEWDSIGLLDSENSWKNKDRVHWNGKEWESKQDANIFEPGIVAATIWQEIGGVAPPPGACDGVAAWDGTQHWSTYTIGDRRTDNGGLYELHTQAWAQSFAPSSANGNLAWTFIQACI
jgi:hypothetical protein